MDYTETPKMFTVDLNERERARYAKTLRAVSEHALKTAEALEAQPYQESKFVVSFIVLMLLLNSVGELGKIVRDAAAKDAPPEFPSFIND